MDTTGSVVVGGMGSVTSSWVSEERNRIWGREGNLHKDLVSDATEREHSSWRQFNLLFPLEDGAPCEAFADARGVRTWRVVNEEETAEATRPEI